MYKPSILFERTPEEYQDPLLAWRRPDIAFFGAGACHILAFAFLRFYSDKGFSVVHIRPTSTDDGHHVYASDGAWAFDHNGWTKEEELLTIHEAAERQHNSRWTYERVVITEDLAAFCQKNNHMLPEDFPYSPWERAFRYIRDLASSSS